jgi:D-alanyl-D-alanine carboxypeptidase (penicillin-binding protein 5/6)
MKINDRRLTLGFIIFLILVIICLSGTLILYRSGGGKVPEVTVDLEQLDSPYAVLMDASTGTVMASKAADEVIFPASLVKIMTVLVAIEEIKKLNQTVTMDADIYTALYEADASRAGFEPGEEVKVTDLLYGAILPSGAECCIELAVQAAGSESAFVEKMNEKAQKLGLTNTHFTNCTGLHDDDQYSTVTEIAEILRTALKNKTFYQVITTKEYTSGSTDQHPDGLTFVSSMFKGMESSTVIGGEILGGKTGYTGEAGRCLASFAELDGRTYILVTAGWAASPRVEQYHINDAFLAYNALGRALEA